MLRPETQSRIADAVAAAARDIADVFYEEMSRVQGAARFLESELVDGRLRASMAGWVRDLLGPRDETEQVSFEKRQAQVGLVHARIGVPMGLVVRGMSVLRGEIASRLEQVLEDRSELFHALLDVNARLDEALAQINDSYLAHALTNERNDQSMRMQIISHNLAVECERLRSSLFDWMRRQLLSLYGDETAAEIKANSVQRSEIGLWITHKAALLFPETGEATELGEQLVAIDEALFSAVDGRDAEGSVRRELVGALNECVNRAGWLLGSLVEHALEGERTLDPLTRVLTRRYLPGVMQREIKISLRNERPFAALMVDADHFKRLNDEHGHAVGDKALVAIGEALLSNLRANDFVFRFGGEEFLAVLGEIQEEDAVAVADKLRIEIENKEIEIGKGATTRLTVSIGIALHDGHPDYQRVIDRADAALLRAKAEGRNRCVLAPSPAPQPLS